MNYIKELKTNPDNPRTINKEEYRKLKTSIKEFTKFLKVRQILYDENKIIWAGNQRFRALKRLVREGLLEDNPEFYKELINYTLKEKNVLLY
jgi:ParB-like chromosome segregation protein Spo0J